MQLHMPVSAIAWRTNGTALALGSPSGHLELHEAYIERTSHNNSIQITYLTMCHIHVDISPNGTLPPICQQSMCPACCALSKKENMCALLQGTACTLPQDVQAPS